MTRWGSQVRLLHRPSLAAVAQLVEQWTENPCVISSILIGGRATLARVAHFFSIGRIDVGVVSSQLN